MTNATIIGCGYVGKAVAQRWRSTLTVTATTTTPDRVADLESVAQRVQVVKGNDEAGVRSLLQDQAIVLLSIGAPNANAYEETYLQTAKTLVAALKDAPTVQQVIYTGSYAVYGDRQGGWVDETSDIVPANRNGELLAETEQILLAASDVLKVCVLRLGGIYGPGRELTKIFGRAAGTTRPGNGEDAANWVHLDDIVGAIDFARQQSLTGVYNLVGTVPTTTGVLLERLFATHGLPNVTWNVSQSSTRPYNARVSNQKLREAGYQFLYPQILETV
ncbi:NAD-dependent epimerase/dehydratase family protein [Leptolyngbya sp. FACHB-321]|uniref:NAD-dependent epimerase/dehydratase family protein n=1 Tax=Leptolyngbya sp. FACHB-321 TaxID=2692807 RepID=UPI001687428D|nr:NAD-dependent epimerase/dehydratase family protein [Leptolyngbya sp. FACHB-321]MBD2038080.1 NAD-dependent epimerase/dehydratase family protein [Leptolyngbya sp. FACHB-321]